MRYRSSRGAILASAHLARTGDREQIVSSHSLSLHRHNLVALFDVVANMQPAALRTATGKFTKGVDDQPCVETLQMASNSDPEAARA